MRQRPKWTNYCTSCTYLGTDSKDRDWHVCSNAGLDRLVICKTGNSVYEEVSAFIKDHKNPIIRLALHMGLVLTNGELEIFGKTKDDHWECLPEDKGIFNVKPLP